MSWLIFQHYCYFPKEGRDPKVRACYGMYVLVFKEWPRQIRAANSKRLREDEAARWSQFERRGRPEKLLGLR